MNKNDQARRIDAQFKYYPLLTVVYAILMVSAQSMAFRMLQIGPFIEPGGIFIFPASFAVADIIAEVYGPTLARQSILYSLIAQGFFSFSPIIVNLLPYPANWHHAQEFKDVFNSSWLVFLSNVAAVSIGMVLNTQIIGKTKALYKGKFFELRSLASSAIGELILTFVIVAIALAPVVGIQRGLTLFINMFLFKTAFSVVVVPIARYFVDRFKKWDDVDVYEKDVSINPGAIFFKRKQPKDNVINFKASSKPKKGLSPKED